jgi:hypothetical protein
VFSLPVLCGFVGASWAEAPSKKADDLPPRFVLDLGALPADGLRSPRPKRLWPSEVERIPGNAALAYYRALYFYEEVRRIKAIGQDKDFNQRETESIVRWIDLPLGNFPRKEVRAQIGPHHLVFPEVALGARRKACDWDLDDRSEGFSLIKGDLSNGMVDLGRLLALKARLDFAEGRSGEAIETIGSGLALARGMSRGPDVYCVSYGIGVASMMADRLDELVGAPGGLDLAAVLEGLPNPFFDVQHALTKMSTLLELQFPWLRELEKGAATPERIQAIRDDLGRDLKSLFGDPAGGQDREPQDQRELLIAAGAQKFRPALQAKGVPAEVVRAMPDYQVVILNGWLEFRRAWDALVGCPKTPYWEHRAALEAADKAAVEAFVKLDFFLTGGLYIRMEPFGQTANIVRSQTLLERRIAALRCVAAIRRYAADHQGMPPTALDALAQVTPIVDPLSGQPFGYEMTEDKVTLSLAIPPKTILPLAPERLRRYGATYELRRNPSPGGAKPARSTPPGR